MSDRSGHLDHLSGQCRVFYGQIYGASADRAGLMDHPSWDCHHLSHRKNDFVVLELDSETTVYDQKGLIRLWVPVPEIGFGHDAYAHDMIVDCGQDAVEISISRSLDEVL